MKTPNSVLSSYGTTVFEVMSRLAMEHQAINLGQGFPDQDGPADILEVAAEALTAGPNQYPPMLGLPAGETGATSFTSRVQNTRWVTRFSSKPQTTTYGQKACLRGSLPSHRSLPSWIMQFYSTGGER